MWVAPCRVFGSRATIVFWLIFLTEARTLLWLLLENSLLFFYVFAKERFSSFGLSFEQIQNESFPDRLEHGGVPQNFMSETKVFEFPIEMIS